jgi:hypothetical protein
VNAPRPSATTGYEKGSEQYWAGLPGIDAGTQLENTNPCVNLARALAGHNEE